MRNQIWDMIYCLIDERYRDELPLYEGVHKYEVEVQDIIDDIEDLAAAIEKKIIARDEYISSGEALADKADEKLHQEREERGL